MKLVKNEIRDNIWDEVFVQSQNQIATNIWDSVIFLLIKYHVLGKVQDQIMEDGSK